MLLTSSLNNLLRLLLFHLMTMLLHLMTLLLHLMAVLMHCYLLLLSDHLRGATVQSVATPHECADRSGGSATCAFKLQQGSLLKFVVQRFVVQISGKIDCQWCPIHEGQCASSMRDFPLDYAKPAIETVFCAPPPPPPQWLTRTKRAVTRNSAVMVLSRYGLER